MRLKRSLRKDLSIIICHWKEDSKEENSQWQEIPKKWEGGYEMVVEALASTTKSNPLQVAGERNDDSRWLGNNG